jgi:uncharacterized membrane protein YagU involved in acid resistance
LRTFDLARRILTAMSTSVMTSDPAGERGAGGGFHPRILEAILWGGTVAGILDITDAFVVSGFYGVSPARVLQAIASGLLGRASFTGGVSTAALGLGLHFFIAFTAAAVYVLASLKLPVLIRRPLVCGAIYGVIVWLMMREVVLPLSLFNQGRLTLIGLLNGLFAHIVCVGFPIALATKRTASPNWRTTM